MSVSKIFPHEGPESVALPPTDAELARASAGGSEDAFRELYGRYVAKVRSTLVRLAGHSYLDDMTQETFLRVWRGIGKLRHDEAMSSWIYRIAVHVAMDQLRSGKRMHLFAIPNPEAMCRDDALVHETRQWVRAGLEALSFEHRSVLVLHDLEQLTETEVAAVMEIPRGTVKSRLFYARQSMRRFLKGEAL